MSSFSERFRELINSYNLKNDNEFALLIEDSNENISRIASGKVSAPKITFLQKVAIKCKLNPYKLYKLLTGEVYTEKPNGSMEAENEFLKEKLKEKEKHLKEKETLISDLKEDKARLRRQIDIKDDQITKYDAHAKRMEKSFNMSFPPSSPLSHNIKHEEGQSGVSVGANEEKPEEQTPH